MTATGTAPARTPLDTGRLRARLASGEPTVGTFLADRWTTALLFLTIRAFTSGAGSNVSEPLP